ncbi:MAG: helix-turn-helix domain-containing protein [Luteolibacter sp.]
MILSAGKSTDSAGLRYGRGPGFPHWSAGFFLGGLTEISCGGRSWELPGQHAVILAPHTPYELVLKKRQHEVWMIFDPRPHLLEALRPAEGAAGPIVISLPDPAIWTAVRAGLRDLLDWWGAQVPHLPLAENAMERVLLLARLAAARQQPTIADERIARVIGHISEGLDREFGIGELARVAGLSVSRFSWLFKERTGLAPVKFLEARRIERARHLLLTTDLPVQQVGLQVGFPNTQHFSTRFRKLTGQSPRAFRAAPQRRFGELNPSEG